MRLRLVAAAAGALALGAAVTPAHATPYAGDYRYLDSGVIDVRGADGARWVLEVFATQSGQVESRAEQALYLDLSRCTGSRCVSKGHWVRPLTGAEISISPVSFLNLVDGTTTKATLHTVLGGRTLDVRLTGTGVVGTGLDSASVTVAPAGARPQAEQWAYANGTARLGALTCAVTQDDGTIGEVKAVDSLGDDTRDPRTAPPAVLPAGFLTGARAARC